jgi:hypothetical protein
MTAITSSFLSHAYLTGFGFGVARPVSEKYDSRKYQAASDRHGVSLAGGSRVAANAMDGSGRKGASRFPIRRRKILSD